MMKIGPINSPEIIGKYKTNIAKTPPSQGAAQSRDELRLTESGKLFAAVLREASAAPDVRGDLVAEMKEKIESGNYTVDANKIAEKMLEFKLF